MMKNSLRIKTGWGVPALAALLALAGCGGGGDDAQAVASAPTRESAATYSPAVLPPLVTTGPSYYFSDCETGAQPGCVPGDNANAGTSPSAPKRTLDGFNINALPAGSQVLFARGGAWSNFAAFIVNPNATPTQPIVFDTYATEWGGNHHPILKVGSYTGFVFGWTSDTTNDGGYTIRNIKLDGEGVGVWGIFAWYDVRNLTIDNVEITGFEIALHTQNIQAPGFIGNTFVTLRRSYIHHNREMGVLGDANDLLIESNTFTNNNASGSWFNHAIYLSGHGQRGIIRYNIFINNSVADGICTGGNVTVHGQWEGLVIEGNHIQQDASADTCQGISINPGYGDRAEWFHDVVVRGNTVVNLGSIAIGLTSAPGAVVENNLVINTQQRLQVGIAIPDRIPGEEDEPYSDGAIVRNNTIYFAQPGDGGSGIGVRDIHDYNQPGAPLVTTAGSNITVVSNLVYFGSSTSYPPPCFEHAALARFAAFDNNLCYHASGGRWSSDYSSLAAAQTAGFDLHGLETDPLFVALPTANSSTDALQTSSPAIDAGHSTLSSTHDRTGVARTVPNIGARE